MPKVKDRLDALIRKNMQLFQRTVKVDSGSDWNLIHQTHVAHQVVLCSVMENISKFWGPLCISVKTCYIIIK